MIDRYPWQILGFDALGRPTSSQQITAGQTLTFPNYTFNLADKLTSVTYPIYGRVVSTTYDLAGRPVGASGVLNSVTTTYASVPLPPSSGYASHGALQQVTLGNNLVEQSCFNSLLQPTVMRVGSSATSNCANSGVDPLNLGYGYTSGSNNGNVASQTVTRWTGSSWSATMNYSSYDGLNRLTNTSEGSGWSEANGYDEFGNRWANITGLTTTLETPATQSWYTNGSHATNNQIYQWGYDGAGNVTSVSGMSRAFSYDGENRQTVATINSTQVTTYVYDGDGRRVQKAGPGGTTTYVYDAQGQLAQESGPATLGTSYLTTDALGSTRLLTDGSGAQLKCYDYTPFGTEIPSGVDGRPSCYGSVVYPSAPDVVSEKFTSKERDAETGLDFFESRYYSSAQGRFTSPDEFKGGFLDAFSGQAAFQAGPLPYADISDPQTLNKYAYVRNNPLRYTDPNGHCIEDLCIGEAIVAYTAATAVAAGAIYYSQKLGEAIGNFIHGNPSTPAPASTPPSTSTDLTTGTPPSTSTAAPGSQVVNSTAVPTQVPGFVADAGGNVVKINPGSTVRPADNGNGVVYQPPTAPGANPNADQVRVMGPDAHQPTGSITVHGPTGQPINPATGKPDTRPNTHTPIIPKKPDDQQLSSIVSTGPL